jgi:hypothetical protein
MLGCSFLSHLRGKISLAPAREVDFHGDGSL